MVTRDDAIRQKNDIERFLSNGTVQLVLKDMRTIYLNSMAESDEPKDQRLYWVKVRVLDEFGAALQAVVDAGNRAEFEIEREKRARESGGAGLP